MATFKNVSNTELDVVSVNSDKRKSVAPDATLEVEGKLVSEDGDAYVVEIPVRSTNFRTKEVEDSVVLRAFPKATWERVVKDFSPKSVKSDADQGKESK